VSCPDDRLHAHGRTPSEPPPPPRRGYSLGLLAAWFTSFGSHAAVTAWILLAPPVSAPMVDRGAAIGVEIVIENALAGSDISMPAPASVPEMAEPPVEIATASEPVPPSESPIPEAIDVAPKEPPKKPEVFAPVPRRPQTVIAALAKPDVSPAVTQAAALPSPPNDVAVASVPAVSGAHMKIEAAAPRAGNPNPEYPASARRRGVEGRVVLLVDIRADGTVAGVEIAESSSHDALDAAAALAVRRWLFRPARRDGDAIDSRVRIPVVFRLLNR